MALKAEYSVVGGLALATMVFAIHQNATPTQADIQALPAGTPDVDAAERRATWISAGAVSLVSLLAKDPTMFVIGSGMTIAMALWTRHSNYTESVGGRFLSGPQSSAAGTGTAAGAPEMTQTEPYEMFAAGSDFDR